MLGQVILGQYKVSRLLDEGGMSKIYLARQADPGRDVVVKVLKDSLLTQVKAREHFRREIHIISRFKHPHAVQHYDSSTKEARGPVLVMEYLRGVPLNVLMGRDGRFSPERTGRLLVQLCDVLQAAHDAGIVHRDIKPGNLMVLHPGTPQETLKLMDFGLAKMSSMLYISPDELVDFNLPAASGTPEYIAPEMVRINDMDARGDLYSVGVVLFEMLLGRRPFMHESVEDLMVAHRDERPPRFSEVIPLDGISPAVEAVVQSCLAKSPDDRPKSAWELALAYEKAVGRRLTSGRAATTSAGGTSRLGGLSSATTPRPGGLSSTTTSRLGAIPTQASDRNAVRQSFEANMPEAMALLKLKGFIFDLGGEVIESVPGMIRVRIATQEQKPQGGLLGWMTGSAGRKNNALQPATTTDLELHMERPDPAQPSKLTITLVMRAAGGLMTAEWRNRCNLIGRDLQAYLMGR